MPNNNHFDVDNRDILTPRERQLRHQLLQGKDYQQIADERGTRYQTVANQAYRMRKKTGERHIGEIVANAAIEHDLLAVGSGQDDGSLCTVSGTMVSSFSCLDSHQLINPIFNAPYIQRKISPRRFSRKGGGVAIDV